jgi:hypothetical protein
MLPLNVSLCAVALALAALPAVAASDYDIHYLAEHVPESGMDAHYQSLPWPDAPLEQHRWAPSIHFSTARTTTGFLDIDGPMVAFAATRGHAPGRGYELLAFYSTMDISGGSDRLTLTPWRLRDVPLDLPQPADFSNPRGTYRHYGVGAAFVRDRGHAAQLVAGLLLESVDAAGYEIDYTLAAGADAGASGVIDYSHDATFLTPFVGWQRTNRLSQHWSWTPRARFVYPLPPGDMDVRLTGPGFEVTTPQDGDPIDIGDPYVAAGLALSHAPSGFEIDLGSMLFFPLAERVSHPGVDRAFLVQVGWRWGGHE